jgi:hypothetical protein
VARLPCSDSASQTCSLRRFLSSCRPHSFFSWTEAYCHEQVRQSVKNGLPFRALKSLHDKGTLRLDTRSLGRDAIGNKWVSRPNLDMMDPFDLFKARLVAQGFSRRPGVDCSHTFSHVVNLITLRIVLPLAAAHDMHAHSAHIETAFLNVDLQKDFVMRQSNVRSRWHS